MCSQNGERKLWARVEVFNQRFEVILVDLHDSHLALCVFRESEACAALTMIVWPNSFRIEPGGALLGSVGPRHFANFADRVFALINEAMHFSVPGASR